MIDPATTWPPPNPTEPLAVLMSGGLDSAVLLGEAVRVYPAVYPLYIQTQSHWEAVELAACKRYLLALACPALRPLVPLQLPVNDLYGQHWSTTGENIPDAHSADEAVYLPGRNVILLAKALLWCHLNGVPAVATAPLVSNPFPDATDAFYDGFASIVSQAVNGHVQVLRPYAQLGLHKVDVVRRGRDMPLHLSFSCIQPVNGLHCGRCNKCAERQQCFREAELPDRTEYAS